ncbi:hypothetical protein HUN01_07495 [Nostoc edaphicum CCNP1411]|uniref:Uncharacterized protein n=1 Tax=Nostoc edaphicum CCNP1411 TaxID=1472755 RepID=A0A7D7LBW1_9NOSO|nr:hypothetical protein [Nostoc edaphicum]QMS87429.1 hypothetical protein HUN01_07495 [Nostoc edaphicum CCNP1411]
MSGQIPTIIVRTYANNSRNSDFTVGAIHEHWCQLSVKASLELAFSLPRSQSPTENARR